MPKEIKDYLQSHGIKDVLKRTTSVVPPMEEGKGKLSASPVEREKLLGELDAEIKNALAKNAPNHGGNRMDGATKSNRSRDIVHELVSKLLSNLEPPVMRTVLKMDTDVRKKVAFHLAGLACTNCVSFLLDEHAIDVNDVGDGGMIHCAALFGSLDMIDFLIRRGADVNKPDNDGQTPISWALGSEGCLETVRHLVGRGAKVTDVFGTRSLLQDVAPNNDVVEGDKMKVVKYLIEDLGYKPGSNEVSELLSSTRVSDEIKNYLRNHVVSWKKTPEKLKPEARASSDRERVLFKANHKGIRLWKGGPYWAETNIGAEKPEDYGYYFWWGDTVGYKRDGNTWVASKGSRSDFSFCKSNTPTFDKDKDALRNERWITAEGILDPKYDAACVQWGDGWRMPTKQELDDLNTKCGWNWTTVNGVKGYEIRGKGAYASARIFLPCAGGGYGTLLFHAGSYGLYCSSVPNSDSNLAWSLYFGSGYHYTYYNIRDYGRSVRPVQGFTK